MYTLIINLSKGDDVRRLASVITGTDWPALAEGNTLEMTIIGRDVSRRVAALYHRDFPPDPNQPLPGQLPLLPEDPQ